MAANWRLPILFVCENNLYAMSTHYNETFAAPTIAARAAGYGIEGVLVDGTDFFAVREATKTAIAHAKAGDGPTLLEMQTYRYYGHSKSDKREYRTREEEDDWRTRDCIEKLRDAIQLDARTFSALQEEAAAEVEAAVEFAQNSPEPEVEEWDEVLFA
jgi:TPP-dependent pyruvate/acetoin dehydrogenase alpha subunit